MYFFWNFEQSVCTSCGKTYNLFWVAWYTLIIVRDSNKGAFIIYMTWGSGEIYWRPKKLHDSSSCSSENDVAPLDPVGKLLSPPPLSAVGLWHENDGVTAWREGGLGVCPQEIFHDVLWKAAFYTLGGIPHAVAHGQACFDLQGNGDLLDILSYEQNPLPCKSKQARQWATA